MLVVDDNGNEENEPNNYFKIAQNRVCCTFGYIIRYIGTTNARKKVLWVYSHLKSEFFSDNIGQNCIAGIHEKSLKICLRTVHDVPNNISKVFFLCQKSYWKTTRLKFFIVKKIENQLHFTPRPNKSSKLSITTKLILTYIKRVPRVFFCFFFWASSFCLYVQLFPNYVNI